MKRLATILLVAALGLAPSKATASSIGVFFDQNATQCDGYFSTPRPVTWYIIAILGGDALAVGTTGAELRMTGAPTDWFLNATPPPAANISLGNVLGAGANIAYPVCQAGNSNGILILFTVSGFAPSVVFDRRLQIERHATPSNPNFACPLLVKCDAPTFTLVCVPGGEARINPAVCSCCTAVESAAWGKVKSLYAR